MFRNPTQATRRTSTLLTDSILARKLDQWSATRALCCQPSPMDSQAALRIWGRWSLAGPHSITALGKVREPHRAFIRVREQRADVYESDQTRLFWVSFSRTRKGETAGSSR